MSGLPDPPSAQCIDQETLKWPGGPVLSDGISMVTKPKSIWNRHPRTLANARFPDETEIASSLGDVYGWRRFTGSPSTDRSEPGS